MPLFPTLEIDGANALFAIAGLLNILINPQINQSEIPKSKDVGEEKKAQLLSCINNSH